MEGDQREEVLSLFQEECWETWCRWYRCGYIGRRVEGTCGVGGDRNLVCDNCVWRGGEGDRVGGEVGGKS